MILTGTNQYTNGNQLGNCIATEKGLLKQEDYQHILKVIEVYSKALLCQIRENHQVARYRSYLKQDWEGYTKLLATQQLEEVKIFNKATIEVLSMAGIKQSVFNQSVALYFIMGENSIHKAAAISFYTPFRVADEHRELAWKDVYDRFLKASANALEIVQSQSVLELIPKEKNGGVVQGDLLFLYDCLMHDFLKNKYGLNADQFRAVVFRHTVEMGETVETELTEELETICATLTSICKDSERQAMFAREDSVQTGFHTTLNDKLAATNIKSHN